MARLPSSVAAVPPGGKVIRIGEDKVGVARGSTIVGIGVGDNLGAAMVALGVGGTTTDGSGVAGG
jgi:hypothetical protein